MEQQQVEKVETKTEMKKGTTNPVLRMELTLGTIALGLFIDLVANGPAGMIGKGGASLIALFAFLTIIVWNMGTETIARFQTVKQDWAPYLPGGERGEDERKTRVLAPPTYEEEGEAATRQRVVQEEPPIPALPMKPTPTMTTTTTRRLDDEETRPFSFQPTAQGEAAPVFPPAREEDTLRWGVLAGTRSRFDPDFDHIFGQGIIIAATQQSGKSHILGRAVEQGAKGGIPAVVFDHKGEYHTISELYPTAIRVGATSDCKLVLTEEHEPQMGQLITALFAQRLQLIIDLPTYGQRWGDRARIIAMVTRSLMTYAEEQRLRKLPVLPCLVLLDEAQLYLPENSSLLPPEAVQDSRGILPELKNAFFAMVSNGRSNGYTVGFATQSLTYIAKWAIKNCQIHIYGRHVEKNDLNSLKDEIEDAVATREDIKFFGQGTAIVTGLTREPVIVQFDRKESQDLSETPSLKRLRSTTTTTHLDHYLTDYQQPQPRVVYTPPVQPGGKSRSVTTGILAPTTTKLPSNLQMVLEVTRRGMSHREIAAAVYARFNYEMSHPTAGKYLQQLKDLRRVDQTGEPLVVK